MKATFKDSAGSTWELRINIKNYISFKEQGLVDLATIFDDNNFLSGLLDGKDMMGFLGILHELCEPQFKKNRVESDDDFFMRFDGDVLPQAAEAFIGAVVAFSPAHRRDALTEAYETMKMGIAETGQAAAEKIVADRTTHLKLMKNAFDEGING